MRIGTEKCPRRVGSDDLKPLTTICEEGVENKRYMRASQEGRELLRSRSRLFGEGISWVRDLFFFQQTFDNRFVKVTMAPMSVRVCVCV